MGIVRLKCSLMVAAWAVVGLCCQPIGNAWAEDVSQPPEIAVMPEIAVVNGFPPTAAAAPYMPEGSPGPAWGYGPDGWPNSWPNEAPNNYEPPIWTPRYGSGTQPQYYGPQYSRQQYYGQPYQQRQYYTPQYAERRYGGPQVGGPQYNGPQYDPRYSGQQYGRRQYNGAPSATVRLPRATRPYWWGPRWQPRGSAYAWNDNGYRRRPNYRNRPNQGRDYGDQRQFGSGRGGQYPNLQRQRRSLPGPSPYGYADAR